MLGWTLTFAISALLAAAFGFSGIDGPVATIGRILFAIFTILFAATALTRAIRGKPPI